MNIKLHYLWIILLVFISCTEDKYEVYDLRCEYLTDPLGIDVEKPHFSWKIAPHNEIRGFAQTGYRIFVASSPEKLKAGKADVWDSQTVESAQSHLVPFGGKLEHGHSYYWKVIVNAPFGEKQTAESEIAHFTTGLPERSEWNGEWIKHPSASSEKHVWFRKSFTIDDKPKSTFVYLASLGNHELYVNGKKVDDNVLAPALARLDKRVLYVTYDIAPLLKKGKNVLAVWYAAGWSRNNYFAPHVGQAMIVQVNGETVDGKNFSFASDESWLCEESFSRNSGKYNFMDMGGEEVDGRRYTTAWNATDFDDSAWKKAVKVVPLKRGGEPTLSAQMTDPTEIVETLTAQNLSDSIPGLWRADMGKSFTGFVEATFNGLNAGDTVVISVSNRKHFIEEHKQIQYYIARGENGEQFSNRFNFFGGRYISFKGLKQPPKQTDIIGYAITSAAKRTGYFDCSDSLFNRIYETDMRTYEMCTTEGFTVDCPNRERLGYGPEGGYQTTWGMGLPCFSTGAFYMKNVRDWCDVQNEDGSLNYVAPQISDMWGCAMNGTAVMNIAWEHYMAYGDKRILEKTIATGKRWVDYLNTFVRDDMLTPFATGGHFLGEWVSPGPVFEKEDGDNELFFNNCIYVMTLELYIRIAATLGRGSETGEYAAMLEKARHKIHEKYYNPAVESYLSGDQVRSSFALYAGIVPEKLRPAVLNHLKNDMTGAHPYINIGSFNRYQYYHVLFANPEFHEILSDILSKTTYPGYGYFLAMGETTWPETWEIEHPNSANIHTSYVGISAWFIKCLAGIEPIERNPGYRTVSIRPNVIKKLDYAQAGVETPYGMVESGWYKRGDATVFEITVPPGCDAEIYLPASKITEKGLSPDRIDGVKSVAQSEKYIFIKAVSGKYVFESN